jgi:hypothetical protein
MIQAQKFADSFPDEVNEILLNLAHPFSLTVALGSTQPLAEMSTKNLPWGGGGKLRPARKADNFTTIYEWII